MPRQSITLTEPNENWLRNRVANQEFANKSEVVNDLIRRERLREEETERIRTALIEGESSGTSELSIDEIWAQARKG
ncbi:CopG family transcriptional regulator [Pelagicoccus sp. NFK12]|uniref:CopG family transcriptional regulator n=1 Tax=Pelagicoccus enzymogenes TaxID=2773457 RepID=A0A927FC49_9BACT|nr:CopG family transcriptional regulator [Pelagicoccus enzymogenes]MBD5782139.1 CopG family transcriptional regulator [Pelagicoccus enzymogenes]MDQ8196892.1 hypothetical protein [Pelagicoccus enzymogenes]